MPAYYWEKVLRDICVEKILLLNSSDLFSYSTLGQLTADSHYSLSQINT